MSNSNPCSTCVFFYTVCEKKSCGKRKCRDYTLMSSPHLKLVELAMNKQLKSQGKKK